jgi:hypothetical protein
MKFQPQISQNVQNLPEGSVILGRFYIYCILTLLLKIKWTISINQKDWNFSYSIQFAYLDLCLISCSSKSGVSSGIHLEAPNPSITCTALDKQVTVIWVSSSLQSCMRIQPTPVLAQWIKILQYKTNI